MTPVSGAVAATAAVVAGAGAQAAAEPRATPAFTPNPNGSAFDSARSERLKMLRQTTKRCGLPDAMAAALMARAVAVERDVTRLTAAAAAAADAKDYAAEAAADAELKSLMSSPQRWVEVGAETDGFPSLRPPSQLFSLLCRDSFSHAVAAIGWALRALLALRVPVPVPAPAHAVTAGARADQRAVERADESVLTLDHACIRDGEYALPYTVSRNRGLSKMAHALLDLPARAYGVDVNARDAVTGASAVWMACSEIVQLDVALATRLLQRSSADALNCRGVKEPLQPLLHALIERLTLSGWERKGQALIEVCCSESVCPSDGTGLDPLTPDERQSYGMPVVTTADQLDAAEHDAASRALQAKAKAAAVTIDTAAADMTAATHHSCALVRGAIARLTAYAQGFAPALSGALSDCGVAVPAPVQGIVAGYAFKASPYASQWPVPAPTK